MNQRLFALLLALGIAVPALGQTAADLSAKYPSRSVYEVGPDALITAKFAADGKVCEMMVEPRRNQKQEIALGHLFSQERMKELIEEVVPEAERGKRTHDSRDGSIVALGQFTIAYFIYKNIKVEVYGTIGNPVQDEIAIITWRNRTCSVP
jgi:hypothetical protein